jgi:acyl-[acyl-carrier-protein]-phospholipid O-acyltransferase/long-chain-fatty-acid--[acyl-carrier-protein] ligase
MELENIHLADLKYSLFGKRRFLPMFLATFLGSFNDNLLRSGLVVLIAYSASKGIVLPTRPEILVTVCAALLVIPSLLFSSIAGALADKYEKSRLIVYTKIAELAIMAGAFYGFAEQNIPLLMGLLFVSGIHSTFYTPIKFSILPEHLASGELLAGNGFMADGGYLAVLFGMISGGLLVEMPGNVIGIAAVGIACVGLVASLMIPCSGQSHPLTHISFNIVKGSRDILINACREKTVLGAILALSWFLAVGSVFISQFANYAQNVVHANNEVYILFLTVFSVGIAAGSILCDTLLRGEISAKFTPYAAVGISVFTALMVITTPHPSHAGLLGFHEFLAQADSWPMLGCMLLVAICGGLYMVPLYALMQSRSNASHRSRVIAASNLSDSIFMTTMTLVSALLLMLNFGVRDLFIMVAIVNLMVAGYARKLVS